MEGAIGLQIIREINLWALINETNVRPMCCTYSVADKVLNPAKWRWLNYMTIKWKCILAVYVHIPIDFPFTITEYIWHCLWLYTGCKSTFWLGYAFILIITVLSKWISFPMTWTSFSRTKWVIFTSNLKRYFKKIFLQVS